MFQDITTLLLDPKAFKDTIDLFVERYKGKNISVVAGKKKNKILFIYFFSLARKTQLLWGQHFDRKLFGENFLSRCDQLEGGGVHCLRKSRGGRCRKCFLFPSCLLLHKFLVVFLNAFERHYGMEETVGGFLGSDFLFDYELWQWVVPLIAPSEIFLERLTFTRSLRACALIQFAWMVVDDGCPGCPTCSNVDPPDASFDWAGLLAPF